MKKKVKGKNEIGKIV